MYCTLTKKLRNFGFINIKQAKKQDHPWRQKHRLNPHEKGGTISWLSSFSRYLPYSTGLVNILYFNFCFESNSRDRISPREGTQEVPSELMEEMYV